MPREPRPSLPEIPRDEPRSDESPDKEPAWLTTPISPDSPSPSPESCVLLPASALNIVLAELLFIKYW